MAEPNSRNQLWKYPPYKPWTEPADDLNPIFDADGKIRNDLLPADGTDSGDVAKTFSNMAAAVSDTTLGSYNGRFVLIAGPQGGLFTVDAAASGTADGDIVIDVNGGAQQLVRHGYTQQPETRSSPARTFTPYTIQGRVLAKPSGFSWTPPVLPLSTRLGWKGSVSARSLRPTAVGTTYYVDALAGDDADAGDSANPLRSIDVALAKSDVGTVKVAPGLYNRLYHWSSPTVGGSSNPIIVEPWRIRSGDIINANCYAHGSITWSVNGSYSNLYDATLSTINGVLDRGSEDALGRFRELHLAASLSDANNKPGSWYYTGGVLSVNPPREGPPDADILCFTSGTNAYLNTTRDVYVEGIRFIGGDEAFWLRNNSGSATGTAVFVACDFMHAFDSTDGQGLRVEGYNEVVLERCRAIANIRDGFNYHDDTGVAPKVVEIGCVGAFNGKDAGGINNGSTMHDAGTILRIGGDYYGNEGPNVTDVGSSLTWCVGVRAADSLKGSHDIGNANFYVSAGSMWLYECVSENADSDIAVTSSGTVYLHNQHGIEVNNSGSTVSAYVQT